MHKVVLHKVVYFVYFHYLCTGFHTIEYAITLWVRQAITKRFNLSTCFMNKTIGSQPK